MKTRPSLIAILKVVIPLCLGVYLIWWNYNALSPEQRNELFAAFRSAAWIWLVFSVVLGWLSHMSRAYRWGFLLEHLGHKTSFWNRYHCTMIGYFMNMLVPRAGEASRALFLQNSDRVPFEKGFGTIIAERAVDLIMLGIVALITLAYQFQNLDTILDRFEQFKATLELSNDGFPWFRVVLGIVVLGGILGITFHKGLRTKVIDMAKGVFDGVSTVWRTPKKGGFVLHTVLIWMLYLAMFAIGFQSVAETASVGPGGILAGFIGGTIGIILVQGGVGIYPPLVAIMVTLYMSQAKESELIHPAALALGWLIWVAQTLMIIVLGGLSLLLVPRRKTEENGTN